MTFILTADFTAVDPVRAIIAAAAAFAVGATVFVIRRILQWRDERRERK